jgi:hypothetical protein
VRLAVAAVGTALTQAGRLSQRLLEMTERRALALQLVVAVAVAVVPQVLQLGELEPVRVLTTQQQRTALVGTLLVMLTAQQTQATVLKEPKQTVRVVELAVPESLSFV